MRTVVTFLLLGTLGLAACGGGSNGDDTGHGGASSPEPQPQLSSPRDSVALLKESRPVTDVVSDSFERAALGSSWSIHVGTPGVVAGNLGLLSGSIAILSWAAPLPADQFSEAEIAAGIRPLMQRQVFVRRRASDSARYALHYNLGVSPQRWELKYDGVPPSQTKLLATATTPSGPVPGDVIRIEAERDVLRGYKNGRLVVQANDTSAQRIVTGAPGTAFVLIGDSVAQPSPVFESWAGGALAQPEPKIVRLSRSGPLVLAPTVRPTCFSVRFVSNARFQHTFTVTNARKKVVWKNVGLGGAGRPTAIQWCGRTSAKTPNRGKILPAGKYRARLDVSVAHAGEPPASSAFYSRTWRLEITN